MPASTCFIAAHPVVGAHFSVCVQELGQQKSDFIVMALIITNSTLQSLAVH